MKANGTAVYQRQHKRGLTMPQLNAIDLLASGKTDKETAELLKLSRTCVTKWRLYSPTFQAALNQRRAEIWGAGLDRLRSLIPQALEVLADGLKSGHRPAQFKAACAVLGLVKLPPDVLKTGPTDAEEIVRQIVKGRRQQEPGLLDEIQEDGKGLPPFERHMADTWQELEALANETEEGGPNTLPHQ